MDIETLYRRYARDVHRFALYLSGDGAAADDITSETFLRAWSSAAPIREATVKAYLFAIARHLYLAELRRSSRQVELNETLAARGPAHDERFDQRAEVQAVARALARLPEIDRAALLMRALGEMPYEAIADALGLTLSNTKVKIHRARLRLAALIPRTVLP